MKRDLRKEKGPKVCPLFCCGTSRKTERTDVARVVVPGIHVLELERRESPALLAPPGLGAATGHSLVADLLDPLPSALGF
jgi:hypothetical protein